MFGVKILRVVRLPLVGVALIVVVGAMAASGHGAPPPRPVAVSVRGSPSTVFSWSRQRCEDLDIPDLPARAFRDAHGRIDLIATHYVDRRFVGRDFNHLRHPCGLIMRSDENPDPAAFDDRGWLSATWTPDGKRVYALVHDEYVPCGGFSCWYNAVTLAVSTNGGATYRAASPRLIGSSPYPFSSDTPGPSGIFGPTNIVRNPRDGYLYAIVQELQGPDDQGDCLIRTKTPGVASSWRAWSGGTRFTTTFANPYGPMDDPVSHLCAHIDTVDGFYGGSLTYSTVAHQWLRVMQGGDGFYYSLSPDLIHWTPPVRFFSSPWFGSWNPGQPDPAGYPSLIDPKSTSRNFDTSGATAYLYYTQFHYTEGNSDLDRDLVRFRVTIAAS